MTKNKTKSITWLCIAVLEVAILAYGLYWLRYHA